ncbi:MAG: DUF429 domain-containing protein [Nocardioidaceae bacterium]|nr:DUF429 domain-containing protein [Nocardioidaceae bacterium]
MTGTTSGIDLAADSKRTAMASILWSHGSAQLTSLVLGVPDHLALHYLHEPGAKVAIDSPLGWPVDFVDFVTAHDENRLLQVNLDLGSPMDSEGNPGQKSTWRRPLANRTTDMYVRQSMPLVPLSVSTDRIAHVAMRAARLMAHCSRDIRRDGAGDIVEAYPAASLFRWRLPYRGYKGAAHHGVRTTMVDDLLHQMPWLEVSDDKRRKLVESDDLLDAFVSALTARAVVLGATEWPIDECTSDRAQREGWIHLPTIEPAQVVG